MDQQPSSQTPQPQSPPPYTPPPAPQSPPPAYQVENPGQTLGVLSIVTAFLFAPVGIALGIISQRKSKQANFSTSLGTIGLILSSIFTALIVLLVLITAVSYNGIQDKALETSEASERAQQMKIEQQENSVNEF